MVARVNTLRGDVDVSAWNDSPSGRLLSSIRRDMEIKGRLFRNRLRNEEILSLAYQEGGDLGGAKDSERIRENALNLPFRLVRWYEAQATSKRVLVKVGRDAGPGQVKGGPGDDETGMWQGITLERVLREAGFRREMNAAIGEIMPRGTSVLRIGYHEQEITREEAEEVGKDVQSVVADALGAGDTDARPGQDHEALSSGLGAVAEDPGFQDAAGREGLDRVLARKAAHDDARLEDDEDLAPTESTRMIRRRIWLQKRRVGEDVGWAPWVYDTEDAPWWWERHVWTVAQVRGSDLFSDEFKEAVEGYDARNVSEVHRGGRTPSTDSMSSDARQAQGEDVLGPDELFVEWYSVWFRRPDMPSGGIRRIVAPEMPDVFVEADESNPHVDDRGRGLIPGFYPFYDFTPIKSSLTVPERTCGIPPMAVGMTQFEKIAEYNRLRHESALRHALRLYQIDPSLKDNKKLMAALENGEDGFAFVADMAQIESQSGKLRTGVVPIQFTGNTQEIDRQAAREEADWVKVQGMPPAVLQGMGTAETATQDQQGIAAGERESGSLVTYLEDRMADVLAGIRGLMRGNYDDEDFQRLLGETGAAVMKAWQIGSVDDGDEIQVTFGATAQAREAVERKQIMEMIGVLASQVDPLTGRPKYDLEPLIEEAMRRFDLGPPRPDQSTLAQLQSMVLALAGQLEQLTGVNPVTGAGSAPNSGGGGGDGPPPGEGDGPSEENLSSGAHRGTVSAISGAYGPA